MADEQTAPAGDEQVNPVVKYFRDFKVLKETKREYWGLQLVNMLDCLAYFAMFNIATVTLSRDFGFTDVGAGLIYTAFSSVTTIFLFFSGVITDWLGIKRALYLAIIGLLITRAGVVLVQYMDEPVRMNEQTQLQVLYHGEGLPIVPGEPDLMLTDRAGSSFTVDFTGATTVGDLLAKINEAPNNNGAIKARIAAGWVSLELRDNTDGTGNLIVRPTEQNPDLAGKLQLETEPEGIEESVLAGQRIISDLNGLSIDELNQGDGLEGGDTLIITDRLGQSMTVTGLSTVTTVKELMETLQSAAEAQPANVSIKLNTPGNGLRVVDNNKKEDGSELKEGAIVISGDAAKPLHLLTKEDAETGGMVSGSAVFENKIRSHLTWILMVIMAPFMAMLITVFQAGNRRFTTKRSRGAGFNLWYLFMNVGAAGGGFLIDIIYLRMGLPHFHVFTFGIATGVLCLLATMMFIRNTDQLRTPEEIAEEEAKKAEERAASEDGDEIREFDPKTGEPKEEVKKGMGPWEITKAVLSEPIFWRFTVLITLLLGVRAVFLYLGLLFPKFWYRVIGEDAQVGLMQAFNPVLVIIGLIVVIPILQKFNVYKMLVFGALITSISMFIPAIPPLGGVGIVEWTYITTGVFLLILTVGELIWSPRLSEYTAAIAPEGQEGTYLGLSMVPYFLAKLVVSALSGAMLIRWCPEFPPGEPNMGERIQEGMVPFWETPYVMWIILGAVALVGTIVAILGKPWFTKGAHFD
jgi:MFS family permease